MKLALAKQQLKTLTDDLGAYRNTVKEYTARVELAELQVASLGAEVERLEAEEKAAKAAPAVPAATGG